MSIGIMVDSFAAMVSGAAKEDAVPVPNVVKVASHEENFTKTKDEGRRVTEITEGKSINAQDQEHFSWIATGANQQARNANTVGYANGTSGSPDTGGMLNKFHHGATENYSVQYFANQPILESSDGRGKKFDKVTYRRKGGTDITTERVEEFTFATAQESPALDKVGMSDDTNKPGNTCSKTLRMKIWETLATVQSPKYSNSQTLELGPNKSKLDQNADQNGNGVVKSRENSDTIETDSESSDHTVKRSLSFDSSIRRPLTRSLTRKKCSNEPQPRKKGPSSMHKQKQQEDNIFNFEEGWSGRLHGAVSGGSSDLKTKKCKKGTRIKPRKIAFPGKENAGQATVSSETAPTAKRTSSLGNRLVVANCCPHQKSSNEIHERFSHNPPDEKGQKSILNIPALPENFDEQELVSDPFLKPQANCQIPESGMKTTFRSTFKLRSSASSDNENQQEVPTNPPQKPQADYPRPESGMKIHFKNNSKLQSPALSETEDEQEAFSNPPIKPQADCRKPESGMASPFKSTSSISPPTANQIEQDFCSPKLAEERSTLKDISNFRCFFPSNAGYYNSDEQTVSSNDEGDAKEAPNRKSVTDIGEESNKLFRSFEEGESESSEEGSPFVKGSQDRGPLSPGTGTAEKSMLHPIKKLRRHSSFKSSETTPASSLPKRTEETDGLPDTSEQDQDDGLARAIALFTLALERLDGKMKSVTQKKSSAILMSAADGIHAQLQNMESQIQKDVGKLRSIGKSKRKHLESKFQDKQEELKLIHEKLKHELNQHIQDCRMSIEGMEAQAIELKGNIERQKTSHRRLLLQAQEAIETQLNEAQTRIGVVRKLAREKMLQLKHVLCECLKEGILS